MKLEIKIDTAIVEPETVITTSAMTDEVNRVVNYISNLENTSFMITGQKDGKIELLDQENIIRLYAENGKMFAKLDQATYQIRLRLYELEERLDNDKFVRISNSEIVNLKKVKGLDLSFAGTICMELENGEVSYVSRRYVSKIKKKLGL
ncbi:MAG: LytTR family transcriptional regulator [Lachnospiraceae bacterium]|nr:LytTR family transcriptional regulator [Lachnospiraceae bacterium]